MLYGLTSVQIKFTFQKAANTRINFVRVSLDVHQPSRWWMGGIIIHYQFGCVNFQAKGNLLIYCVCVNFLAQMNTHVK